jgi:hypothetical protein
MTPAIRAVLAEFATKPDGKRRCVGCREKLMAAALVAARERIADLESRLAVWRAVGSGTDVNHAESITFDIPERRTTAPHTTDFDAMLDAAFAGAYELAEPTPAPKLYTCANCLQRNVTDRTMLYCDGCKDSRTVPRAITRTQVDEGEGPE